MKPAVSDHRGNWSKHSDPPLPLPVKNLLFVCIFPSDQPVEQMCNYQLEWLLLVHKTTLRPAVLSEEVYSF